jgi:hypothetical protein
VSAIGYEYSEQYGNETFWITDEPGSTAASNAEGAFYVYRGKPDNGQAIPVGAEVQLTTTIKKYVKSGAEPVIENTNANLLVQVLSLPQEDTTVVPVDTALNYSIYLYAPDACPEMKPGIIGTFTNWEYSVPMGEALDEKQQLVYIFTLAGQPGDKFKFRDAASEDWSNEILFWDDASYQWVAPQDNVLGEETEIIFDWSDNNRYRFTLCGNMPVDTIEPQPADVPTTEDLVTAGYNVDSALVACFKFDGVVCDDIVFTGTFNGWSENPDECAKFQPLEGFEGWYVVEVPFAIDSVGSLPEGKPVQLQNGEFNWAYQAGDYWIYRGGNEVEFIERAPYIEGEVNVAYPSAGAYIYEIAYWKNFNTPCFESKTHTYVFDIYGPDACPEMRLGVAGSFNDWDLHAIPMDLVPDTTGKLLYTVAILAEEGQEYKFKEANDTTPYWDNELLYWDEGVGAWWAFKNFVFPQAEEEEVHIAMDLSDNAKYRFALCDGAGPQPIDTTEVEVIKPFVMTFNGTIDDWYIGDRASYNESASDPEANKYVFDILGGEPNDAYYKPLPDVLYRTKNTADKQKAFAIHPERCFEFGGKNGVLVIRNTQADDMIWIEVAAKGSSAANFQDEAGLYPVNAAALTEDLILPAKGSDGADEMGYVWRTLEFKSLGGDVEIKEFTGGYRVRSIILDREEQPVDTTVIPEDSVRNYAIYLYAPDACPEMKPAIIGTFTNWEYAVPMEEALDEKQQLVYTFVLEGKPGDRFKFREASSEAWENEIQEWSPMYEQWINLGDNELGEETAWFFNFSNNSQFRFTLCDAEPQPNYITCAEAVALMPADIGAETEKVYAVAGYVTEVLGNMSPSRTDSTIMQQRFWMDDEKGTAHTVQGYWCNLPGYEALNVGDRIVLTGKILNYNGTAEIKNGDVEIIERAPVDTTVIEPQAISIAEALSIGEALEDNASTTEEYILHGFVSAIATEFSEQYGNETFWITDEPGSTAASNAEGAFYVYRGKPDNGQAIPVGAEVQLTTTIKKYVKSGAEPVIENTNANLPVQVLSLPVDTTDYYLIRLYAPDACPEMKPAIIGMFTGWEYAIPMNEEIDENQRTVFTYQLYAEAGTYFKFREASSEAWENEIQRWDEEWQQWVNLGDNLLGEEKVITFDFSDNSMYRFTLCDNDVRYPVFFLDWEGSVISEQEVRAYGAASAPADPYREGFVFTGWSKPFNRITDRLFTVAMYIESSQLVGDHLVNFVDGVDGSLIDTTWVTLNVPAPMPHVGYSFIGWEVVAGSLENDITIKAVYESAQGVNAPEADAAARKVVRDGHLFILSGEKEYTATGMEVK